MSNQAENENQQTEIVTPEEVRQFILAELEASKQAIAELNDEELAEVAGGRYGITRTVNHVANYGGHYTNIAQGLQGIKASFQVVREGFQGIRATRAALKMP